jgi:prepilin-type N-terminal cleavage/methylation domain-containing protein
MKTPVVKKISRWPRRNMRMPGQAFTLVEIMIVVAIIGLIAAMGIPALLAAVQKEGMRKAVSDLQDVCSEARAQAIFHNQTVSVIFHPQERRFEMENVTTNAAAAKDLSSGKVTAAVLPAGIDFALLDINLMDFVESDVSRVRFFPNGTCDEMTVVLHGNGDFEKMSLEFSTGILSLPQKIVK